MRVSSLHGASFAAALSIAACFSCTACHDAGPPPASSATAVASDAPSGIPSAPPAPSAPSASTDTPSASANPSATPAPAGSETVVHGEDDGKTFNVARGSTVTFSLPGNAGTGYVWIPTQVDAKVLTQQGERTSETSSSVPGAPKVDIYHFTAAAPGTTTVEMTLKRPFGGGAPARVIHATVHVQ